MASPSPPAPADEEIVEERQTEVLDHDAAETLLDELRSKLAAMPTARLTLSWRLTRPRGGVDG